MKKRALIIKESDTKITAHENYLLIQSHTGELVAGYMHISSLYLTKNSKIPIEVCYKISQKIPLYLIDHNGYIRSQLIKVKEDA